MSIKKCKFCDKYMENADRYVAHLEKSHLDMIPEDMTPYRFFYMIKTGRTNGHCIICGKDTKWDEKIHKYKRFCENPKCKEKYVETFRKRMVGKYGKVNLLNDPEQQKKMLANRKISGKYRWHDGVEIGYTGTYEKSFLEFLDMILDYESNEIISPSPHTYYYTYEGTQHFYIPDVFIPSLNLEIEVKDGGDNANMHPKIQAVDKEKERLKDEVMRTNGTFNYLKIVNKENAKFFRYLEAAKKQFFDSISEEQAEKPKPIFMP